MTLSTNYGLTTDKATIDMIYNSWEIGTSHLQL